MNVVMSTMASREDPSLSLLRSESDNVNQTTRLNSQAVDLLVRGDCDGAVQGFASALSHLTTHVINSGENPNPADGERPRSSAFIVKTSYPNLGVGSHTSCVAYFERPFLIQSLPDEENNLPTDEQAAYFSSVCFYNMGLAMFAQYKKQPNQYEKLLRAHDSFLRGFDLLAACKLDPNDSKLILLLAICNNLAAIQGDLGNITLLQYWGEKFQVVLGFANAQSHWSDANYHSFRLKQLLNAFSFSSAGAA